MHLKKDASLVISFTGLFTVSALEAINTTIRAGKCIALGVEWVILGIDLASVHTIFGVDCATGRYLSTVAHYNCNFFIIRVNSFFHNRMLSLFAKALNIRLSPGYINCFWLIVFWLIVNGYLRFVEDLEF